MARRDRSRLPPPSLAELARYPTHGATILCLACDRGVRFAWSALIKRHGAEQTWVALGARFRCAACRRRPVLEVRWREGARAPLASWEVHAMARRDDDPPRT